MSSQVQLDIRTGHAQTVDKVLGLVGDDLDGTSVCDAGCGTGSLAIPLALRVSGLSLLSVASFLFAAERVSCGLCCPSRWDSTEVWPSLLHPRCPNTRALEVELQWLIGRRGEC